MLVQSLYQCIFVKISKGGISNINFGYDKVYGTSIHSQQWLHLLA